MFLYIVLVLQLKVIDSFFIVINSFSWLISIIASYISLLDILDLPTISQNLEGVEAFIHAAAMVSFDKRDHKKMMQINVEGTAGLVNLCIEQKVPHFLLISSIAAIGRVKNIDVIDEDTKWQTSELNSQYAISKYYSEMEVWRGGEEGLPFTILNPSVVLGWAIYSNRVQSFSSMFGIRSLSILMQLSIILM